MVVDEEIKLIFYCVSGACGGALVVLAILIGVYIGRAKKNLDKHMKLREEGITDIWAAQRDPSTVDSRDSGKK